MTAVREFLETEIARGSFPGGAALLNATRDAQPFRGLTGEDRAMLYIVASYTGLRASELASLTTHLVGIESQIANVNQTALKRDLFFESPNTAEALYAINWLPTTAHMLFLGRNHCCKCQDQDCDINCSIHILLQGRRAMALQYAAATTVQKR